MSRKRQAADELAAEEPRTVSLVELAQVRGVSENTLRKIIRENRDHPEDPFPIKKVGSHGDPYEFDVDAVAAWWQRQDDAIARAQAERAEELRQMRLDIFGDDLGQPDGDQALSAKDLADEYDARMKAVRLAEIEGQLVRADAMRRALDAAFGTIRAETLQMVDDLVRDLQLDRPMAAKLRARAADALNGAAAELRERLPKAEAGEHHARAA